MKKCLLSNHHSTRVYAPVGTKKRHIDPSRHVGYAVRCMSQVVMTELIFVDLGWRWTASITAMSCCLSRCFQQSNVSLFTHKTICCLRRNLSFLWFPQDRWGGKWNHLSM